MGYDAYSHVIYGIEVDRKILEKTERVRSCNHNIDEKSKFCPECGKPVWVESTVSVLDNLHDDDPYDKGGLSYFVESGDAYNNKNYNFMIGFRLGKTGYNQNRDYVKQPTDTMKEQILDFIRENNLNMTEKDIKMIVYTYHSY